MVLIHTLYSGLVLLTVQSFIFSIVNTSLCSVGTAVSSVPLRPSELEGRLARQAAISVVT